MAKEEIAFSNKETKNYTKKKKDFVVKISSVQLPALIYFEEWKNLVALYNNQSIHVAVKK